MRGKTLVWITAFLFNRKHRVVVKESHSDWVPVISEVPQGSVLGAKLLLLYIIYMTDVVTSNTFLNADDAKIYR